MSAATTTSPPSTARAGSTRSSPPPDPERIPHEGSFMTEAAQNTQPVFSIEKIYVKDLSLEIPNAPGIFLEREAPQVDIQLHHNSTGVEEGVYQCTLTVTVTAKVKDKTMFLVEAAQAGIFVARNIPPQELEPVLAIACPNILFPYV